MYHCSSAVCTYRCDGSWEIWGGRSALHHSSCWVVWNGEAGTNEDVLQFNSHLRRSRVTIFYFILFYTVQNTCARTCCCFQFVGSSRWRHLGRFMAVPLHKRPSVSNLCGRTSAKHGIFRENLRLSRARSRKPGLARSLIQNSLYRFKSCKYF